MIYDVDGIGFCLSENDPFVGLDIDDCLKDGKPINDETGQLIDHLNKAGWYIEISPSGNGIHGFGKGNH